MSLLLRAFGLGTFFALSLLLVLRCCRDSGAEEGRTAPVFGPGPHCTRIALEDLSSGTRWELAREAHGPLWRMEAPVQWPANPFFIDQLLSGLDRLRTSGEGDLFPPPEHPLREGKRLRFFSASGEMALQCSEAGVVMEPQGLRFPLPEAWKALSHLSLKEALVTRLWDWEPSKIDGLVLEFPKKEQRYVLVKKEGAWAMQEPVESPLSRENVERFLSAVTALEVEQFLPEQGDNGLPLGLQMPDYRLTLFCGHESRVLEIGKSFYKKSHLRFAKRAPYGLIFALPCDFWPESPELQAFFAKNPPEEAVAP